MFFLSSKPSQIITIWLGMGKYPFGGFLTRFPPSCMQDQAKHQEEKKTYKFLCSTPFLSYLCSLPGCGGCGYVRVRVKIGYTKTPMLSQ